MGQNPEEVKVEEEDPLELKEGTKHPLFENIDKAEFILMKAPNAEVLKLAIQKKQWPLTNKAANRLKEVMAKTQNVIMIISIKNTNIFQACCRVASDQLKETTNEWVQMW